MNEGETLFTYFRRPHQFSTHTDEPQVCELCSQVRAGYRPPFYGRAGIKFLCEECLAAGRLAEIDAMTNEGDVRSLRGQLSEAQPKLDEEQVESLVRERTGELEHRTPHLVTWQDWLWPAHCGDYCRFLKEAGKPDLNQLAPDADGRAFFADNLYGRLGETTDVSAVWEGIRPDSPKDNRTAYHVAVYLFQCLHCGAHVITWDSD